jgi:hypothetical protein
MQRWYCWYQAHSPLNDNWWHFGLLDAPHNWGEPPGKGWEVSVIYLRNGQDWSDHPQTPYNIPVGSNREWVWGAAKPSSPQLQGNPATPAPTLNSTNKQ